MSTTVDERVVEMRFDNKQFEQNIQTSLSSIDKLKRSLNLEGAAKGLETVNDAAQKCNMSPLTNAVETVRVRFSALEVMAITALQNITNSALAAGKNLVSAFTVDPIKSGFEEYETQINAVQTILANTSSKGTTLDQVNNALDELNHYADMTIYNFTEMTRNIGTFTAAGVDLDTSVAAIKGIANLAAVSGSNSQQASTAMYQLSQALAAGTVKLQDWNSVVNAGMGGQVFQDALKETAKVHGIAIDEMIKDEGSFRETLSKGWLTSDILTETLAKFTGDLNEDQLRTMGYADDQIKSIMEMGKTANDAATKVKTFTQLFDTLKEAAQSGWTQSWEIIVGDFEEAKELLTEVSDTFSAVINASADARNKMLQDWKDLGGRTMMIEAVKNVFEGLVSVAKQVREAFNEIFPPMTGKQLAEITERIRDLTAKFKMGEESSKNLKNTFKGVFAVLDIVGQAFKAVAGGVGELIGLFIPAGNGVLSLTGSFGEYLVKLDETVKKTDVFGKAVSTVVDIVNTAITFVKTAGEKVKEFGKAAGEKFDFPGFELFHSFLERVHDRMAQIGDGAGKMKSRVIVAFEMMGEALEKCKFLKVMEALWTAVKVIAGGIADAVGTMMGTLAEKLGNADFSGVLDILNSIAVGRIALSVSKFLKSVTEPLEGLNGVLEGVTGILDGVRGCFEAYQTNLKAGTLLKIGAAIALLAGSIVAISLIDSDKLSASLGAITVLFANLLGAMAIFNKISSDTGKVSKACTAMIAMSVAVSILAGALKKVSDLDWGELARGLVGIAGLTTIVVASSKAMASSQKQVMKGATSLIIFGAAIKILASACEDLSKLQWDELGRGLTGVGVLFAEIAVFLRVAKFNGKMISTATGIVILSAAMKVLASACKDFGQMEWSEIGKGLAGIGGLLAELAVFTNLAGNAKHVMSTGVALIAIGAAMKIFASAVKDFGQLQWDEIGRGLTAMGGALAEVAIAVNLMPKNMIGIGTGLVIVGGALETIANCMSKFGGMQWEEIGRGLTVMGGALAELAISLNFMKGTLGGSAALLVASGALAVLAPVLSILGALSWEAIAKGLISIAGIGLLSAIMRALSATASLVPGAMVGILGMGAVVAEMALVLAAVGLLSKLPGLSWLIGEGGKLLQGIGTAIGQFVGGIVGGFMSGVSSQFPQIGADLSTFMNNVQPFLQGASQIQPSMMDGVKALAETVLILTAADILQGLTSWLTGGSSLSKFGEELVPFGEAMRDFSLAIGNMDGEIVANAATAGKALAEMAATIPNTGGLVSFFAGENDMTAFGKQLVPFGEAMRQFGDAITGLDANAVTEAAIAGKAMAEMATTIPNSGGVVGFFAGENDMGEFGKQLVPFGEAMKAFGDAVRGLEADAIVNSATAGKALVELADTVPNTGGVVAFFTGNNDVDTFGEKLVPFGEAMKAYSEAIMGMDSAAITNSATAGKALVELANTIPNTGGLVSWFTGDNDLGSFGDSLVQFGSGIKSYSDSISGIDTGIMSSVITQVNRLVEMAKGMAELDTSGMSGFSTALIQLGNNGIDGFINAFTDASGRVTSAATSMLTTFINAANAQKGNLTSTFTTMMQAVLTTLTNYQTQFNTAGSTLMTKFISGIKSQDGNTKTAITNIISGCITAINNKQTQFNTAGANLMIKLIAGVKSKDYETRNAFVNILSSCLTAIANKYPEFQNAGMQCMIKFIAGVKEKAEEVKTAFTGNLNASVTAIRDYHDQFKQAGTYLVEGFADGISENTYRAEAKARAMARAAAEAAEDELDEHSPSRVGYHIGDFFGLGFVNAIGTYAVKAYNASAEMADSAKTGLGNAIAKVKDMIDNGVDGQPTIRPILDLSDVEEKSHRLNTLFSRSQALTVSTGIAAARGRNLQNEDTNPNTGNSYNFTQNNYSPKALSRTEIYRQTKNQFSAMERMVET